jgi:N-formylglutamate deformylase
LNSDSSVFERAAGTTPLVVSFPHVGTEVPQDIADTLTADGRRVPDTDWHVHELYSFVRDTGSAWLRARYSRYVIDLNRPPDDTTLYPGQTTTGLCPDLTFDGRPIYADAPPTGQAVQRRREQYWRPYHTALGELIDAARARHGYAVVLDAHSIRSVVPRLFAGRLPDVNVGTNDGKSCASGLGASVMAALAAQSTFSHVLNGRFKGGHITRHYGQPSRRVHAIQLELAQAAYMDESGFLYDADRARPLQRVLQTVVAALLSFRPEQA